MVINHQKWLMYIEKKLTINHIKNYHLVMTFTV